MMSDANSHQWSLGDPYETLPLCDTIIALWGQTDGDPDALALNSTLAEQSRAIALSRGASRLLHLSSAAVYGPVNNASETTQPAPINAYGHSKLEMERHVAQYEDTGLQHCCLRLANVVGADSLAPALACDGPVTLDRFADRSGPLRSYIGAQDLAEILIALSATTAARLPETLNIAAHTPIAMQDLAQAAGKHIIWRKAPKEAVQRVTMDTSRLAGLLPDIHPETDAKKLINRWNGHRN